MDLHRMGQPLGEYAGFIVVHIWPARAAVVLDRRPRDLVAELQEHEAWAAADDAG